MKESNSNNKFIDDVSSLEIQTISNQEKIENEGISNLFELENIVNQIKDIEVQIENIKNNNFIDESDKKTKIENLTTEKNNLTSKLSKGISVDLSKVKEEITESIIIFLEPFGYSREQILQKLNNVELYVTNEQVCSGALMSAVGNRIGIDYSVVKFDINGNVLGIRDDKEQFVKYVLTHEFLHICSNNGPKSHMNEALSEGLTDMFAISISGNNQDKSNWYDIFVKICILLSNIIGIEGVVNDNFTNLDTTPNIRKLFADELSFLEFFQGMDKILELKMNNGDKATIYTMQIDLINKIKNEIFIPFLEKQQNKEVYIELFNNLFSEHGITCSLDEVKSEENIV